MLNLTNLVFYCAACGNRAPQYVQYLAINLIGGTDHKVSGALELIGKNGVIGIPRNLHTQLPARLDPSTPGNLAQVLEKPFYITIPGRNRRPDGCGIWCDPEPQKPPENLEGDLGKPLCVCSEHVSGNGGLCGCQDETDCPCPWQH